MTGGVGFLEKGNGVEVIRGTARFVAADAVEVDGGGERTRVEAPGLHRGHRGPAHRDPRLRTSTGRHVWSAREAVDLPEIPKRLVVHRRRHHRAWSSARSTPSWAAR